MTNETPSERREGGCHTVTDPSGASGDISKTAKPWRPILGLLPTHQRFQRSIALQTSRQRSFVDEGTEELSEHISDSSSAFPGQYLIIAFLFALCALSLDFNFQSSSLSSHFPQRTLTDPP